MEAAMLPVILHIMAEMSITASPNPALCMWLETDHIFTSKAEEKRFAVPASLDSRYEG